MTPTTPPPSPPVRFHGMWDDVDQARRAWAITQACRLLASVEPNSVTLDLEATAIRILDFVLEQQR